MVCESQGAAKPAAPHPKWVGGYEIGARIGEGPMHAAKCPSISRKLSCKLVCKERQGFFMLNEARVISRLNSVTHPNIAKVLDVAQNDSGTLLVLEGLGIDLHTLLRQAGRFSEEQARSLFGQIASGVERCHAMNVVLRDIKLSKIYTSSASRGTVKIADLDRSCVLDTPDQPMLDAHGSPAYVAPEMLTRAPYSGQSADLWSLGVILHTMLTGAYPFNDTTPAGLFTKIKTCDYAIPATVSPAAAALIARLLSPNPQSRGTARDLVRHPWLCMPLPVRLSSCATSEQDDQCVPDVIMQHASA
eukprot:Opistho-2@75344